MRWREGYVPGGGTRFWVRETGRGDELALLLHGFPLDGSSWAGVAALLAERGWRVAAPDVKGVGRTRTDVERYDPRTLADEVSQLIRNLHGRSVTLVGHGWGGAIALATAFRHPGRVDRLVLVGSPYRALDHRHAWHVALCNVPVLPEVALRVAARPLVARVLESQTVVEVDDREVVTEAAAALAGSTGWLRYYRTLSRRAEIDRLGRAVRTAVPGIADPVGPPRLRVPARVVWGQRDPVHPLHVGVGVARDLGAQLDVLPGVGHHVPLEDPSGLVASLERAAGRGVVGPAGVAGAG